MAGVTPIARPIVRTLLWGALFAGFLAGARAERLPVRTYTTTDGLPGGTVLRIRGDSRGFLWFLTADGLARFDGHFFTRFRG